MVLKKHIFLLMKNSLALLYLLSPRPAGRQTGSTRKQDVVSVQAVGLGTLEEEVFHVNYSLIMNVFVEFSHK